MVDGTGGGQFKCLLVTLYIHSLDIFTYMPSNVKSGEFVMAMASFNHILLLTTENVL